MILEKDGIMIKYPQEEDEVIEGYFIIEPSLKEQGSNLKSLIKNLQNKKLAQILKNISLKN